MIEILYGKRKHSGGLKESLKTSVYIEEEEFYILCKKRYHFYGYDKRINQVLFIAKDMLKEEYTWLFIEIKIKQNNNPQ